VVLGARRVDRLQSLVDELTGRDGKALAVSTDVTHCDQVKGLVEAAVKTYGRIDVMINNAGLMPLAPLERQRWGGPIEEIQPGDVVWIAPGEKHWHGACPTTAMTHTAIQEQLDGKVVEWMEKVSDEQYQS
jgi:NAD(P)-dependent dehydrogenase (short-subunit alcohol dehydrogenase family)